MIQFGLQIDSLQLHTVTEKIAQRSYTVDTGNGTFRTNRRHLITSLKSEHDSDTPDHCTTDNPNNAELHSNSDQEVTTRSRRVSSLPTKIWNLVRGDVVLNY